MCFFTFQNINRKRGLNINLDAGDILVKIEDDSLQILVRANSIREFPKFGIAEPSPL